MILIADSGASKTAWRLLKEDGSVEQFLTKGYNPYYQPAKELDEGVAELMKAEIGEDVSKIFYYGAGCSSEGNKDVIQNVLNKYFEKAKVEVEHDLLAAARALCGHEPGIACILGTGANSCYFDGAHIQENVASLGYVLGDEGSGAYLGKTLVGDYLRNDVPAIIGERFAKRFGLDRETVLENVYHREQPGRFLASFAKFIFQNLQDPYCYQLVYRAFSLFFEKNVVKYPQVEKVPVHFTGSVAFYFGNILRQVAGDKGIHVKNIVEGPIAGLTLFHQKG